MISRILITLLLSLLAFTSKAETVSVLIPFAPGGPTDQLWRAIEPSLNERLKEKGIKLITENLPGAGGTIAANKIAGTTDRLVLGFFSPALAIAPAINPSVVRYSLDTISLIGYAGQTEMVLVSSFAEEDLKKKCANGSITFGSSNIGSTSHLLGTYVSNSWNCKDAVHVPYKGQSLVYIDLIAGRVDYLVDFAISAEPQILTGKVRKISTVNDGLENWHVLVSNNTKSREFEIIKQEFEKLKSDREFVRVLEQSMRIRNFSKITDQRWLAREFDTYKNFVKKLK